MNDGNHDDTIYNTAEYFRDTIKNAEQNSWFGYIIYVITDLPWATKSLQKHMW